MSAIRRPYVLKHRGDTLVTDTNVGKDISEYVVRIDKFMDIGTGSITSAQIMLNSTDGQFLTRSDGAAVGATPLLDQFDEFLLEVEDDYRVTADDPTHKFRRIMYLHDQLPQETLEGQLYQLELYGREMYMKRIKIPGHFYFITFQKMIQTIIEYYNAKRGSEQPRIFFDEADATEPPDVDVPPYLVGTFDFHLGVNCYDALMSVVARLNLPVAAGGAGRFHELFFTEHSADATRLICRIKPLDTREPDITLNGHDRETQSITETKQPIDATIIVAKGQADTGRYPVELAQYTSRIEEYANFPEWDATLTYAGQSYVRYRGNVFQVISATVSPPVGTPPVNGAVWDAITEEFYVRGGGNANFQYSPLTGADLIKSYCSNSTAINFNESVDSPAFPDANLTIRDGVNYRDSAHCKINKNLSDIPVRLRYARSSPPTNSEEIEETLEEDFRVLIDGSDDNIAWDADSPFYDSTTDAWKEDRFGKSYYDALVQWSNGAWIVIREPHQWDEIATLADNDVWVPHTAVFTPQSFRNKPARTAAQGQYPMLTPADNYEWRSTKRGTWLGIDCFHFPKDIQDVKGLVHPFNPGTLTDNSAVKVTFEWGKPNPDAAAQAARTTLWSEIGKYSRLYSTWLFNLANAAIRQIFLVDQWAYSYGWWTVLFKVPTPRFGPDDDRTETGAIFGGDIDNKVSALDLKNLNHTHDGKTGWDTDSSSELGPITGIHFLFNFDLKIGANRHRGSDGRLPGATGNQVFRVIIHDALSNKWYQDFTYRFLGDTQQVILPISGFKIYRARNPIAFSTSDVIKNIITPELLILEIFETRKIKMITMQWQESYDEAGRYSPWSISRTIVQAGATLFTGGGLHAEGIIDGFGFVKAPIAIALGDPITPNSDTSIHKRHLMNNVLEYPGVSNVEQLQKIANAELELAQFRKDNFIIRTTGKCDLRVGDIIYFHDVDMIGLPMDRKKLLVKKINYTVNAIEGEGSAPSGFVRWVTVKDVINLG